MSGDTVCSPIIFDNNFSFCRTSRNRGFKGSSVLLKGARLLEFSFRGKRFINIGMKNNGSHQTTHLIFFSYVDPYKSERRVEIFDLQGQLWLLSSFIKVRDTGNRKSYE